MPTNEDMQAMEDAVFQAMKVVLQLGRPFPPDNVLRAIIREALEQA